MARVADCDHEWRTEFGLRQCPIHANDATTEFLWTNSILALATVVAGREYELTPRVVRNLWSDAGVEGRRTGWQVRTDGWSPCDDGDEKVDAQ